MASSSNGSGNLMDEFEEAFQACLHALTKQESNAGVTKDEIELEVQQTANKFMDVARQMEAFFLQKRFLISALKPEMLLKDENTELKFEISRKDNLINKHYNRLEEWKAMLSEQQQQGYGKPLMQQQGDLRSINNPGQMSGMSSSSVPVGQMSGGASGSMPTALQAQLQQQHLVAQQQQQQQMMQAQQLQQMQQMQVGAQQMYMQQQQQQSGPQLNRTTGMGFNQGGGNAGMGLVGNNSGSGNMLQGHLAYLEKTTSNIDLIGMGEGRR